jgi:hypothetical protein
MPTHSEALLEAYASCPPSARVYHTLEIWQSSFDQAARVVANVGDDMTLGIENGAPRDGGSMVSFIACPLSADYPEQREGQPPSCKISIDNVTRELVPKIRAALGVRLPFQVQPNRSAPRHRARRYFRFRCAADTPPRSIRCGLASWFQKTVTVPSYRALRPGLEQDSRSPAANSQR